MKKYLEEVVKVKMEVTSVSLPKWKGKDTITSSEIGSYDQSALKYKKVTAYAETVRGSYRAIRSIKSKTAEGSDYAQYTRLYTRDTNDARVIWTFNVSGAFDGRHGTHNVFGIRPAIEY